MRDDAGVGRSLRYSARGLGFYSVASVRRSSTSGDAAVSRIVHRLGRQPEKRGPLDPPRDWIRRDAVEADREVRTIDTPPPRSWFVASVVTFVQVDILGSTAGGARWHVTSLPAGVGALGRGADGQHNRSATGVNSPRLTSTPEPERGIRPSRGSGPGYEASGGVHRRGTMHRSPEASTGATRPARRR